MSVLYFSPECRNIFICNTKIYVNETLDICHIYVYFIRYGPNIIHNISSYFRNNIIKFVKRIWVLIIYLLVISTKDAEIQSCEQILNVYYTNVTWWEHATYVYMMYTLFVGMFLFQLDKFMFRHRNTIV